MRIKPGMTLKVKKDPQWLAGKTPVGTVIASKLYESQSDKPYLEFVSKGLQSRERYRRILGMRNGKIDGAFFHVHFEIREPERKSS